MAKRRSKKSYACKRGIVTFRSKRGKIISFKGKHGAGCAPRKKPSTRHLSSMKSAMKRVAKKCAGKKIGAFRSCMRQGLRAAAR